MIRASLALLPLLLALHVGAQDITSRERQVNAGGKGESENIDPNDPYLGAANIKESDESKATILGIDSDEDGVRDDVQEKIDFLYSYRNSYVHKKAREMARSYQEILSDELSPGETIKRLSNISTAADCINKNGGDPNAGKHFLRSYQLSTYERARAFLRIAEHATQVEGLFIFIPCEQL